MSSIKKIKTNDNQLVEVDRAVIVKSLVLQATQKDVIDVDVSRESFEKVVEYCKKHVDSTPESELKSWDAEFVKVYPSTLVDIWRTARLLMIDDLCGFIKDTIAYMLNEMSVDEFRFNFDIKKHLTNEELSKLLCG